MYTGPTEELVPWFNSLGYPYNPEVQGTTPDWALDLVSLGFDKAAQPLPHQQMRKDSLQESLQESMQKLPAVPRKLSKGSAGGLPSCKSGSGGFAAAAAAAVVASAGSPAGFDEAATEHSLQDGCSLYGSCSSGSCNTIPAVCHTDEDLQLMTTKEQLEYAAVAFKEHLQQRQPELFGAAAAAAAAASRDPHLAVAPGAEVAGDAAAATAAAGAPGASSWAKYKALLWREVLVMTRYVLPTADLLCASSLNCRHAAALTAGCAWWALERGSNSWLSGACNMM
jgi:hypothetical protein